MHCKNKLVIIAQLWIPLKIPAKSTELHKAWTAVSCITTRSLVNVHLDNKILQVSIFLALKQCIDRDLLKRKFWCHSDTHFRRAIIMTWSIMTEFELLAEGTNWIRKQSVRIRFGMSGESLWPSCRSFPISSLQKQVSISSSFSGTRCDRESIRRMQSHGLGSGQCESGRDLCWE